MARTWVILEHSMFLFLCSLPDIKGQIFQEDQEIIQQDLLLIILSLQYVCCFLQTDKRCFAITPSTKGQE